MVSRFEPGRDLLPLLLIIVTCGLMLTDCSGEVEESLDHSFRVFQEDGITISENKGGPKYDGELFSFEKVCTIKEEDGLQESLMYSPDAGATGPSGEIYIEDRGNHRIAVFEPDGTFRTSFGREGNGPGEFQVFDIFQVNNDSIMVFDYMLSRTTVFRTDGTLLQTLSSYSRAGFLTELYPLADGGQIQIERKETRDGEERYRSYTAVVKSPAGDTLGILVSKSHSAGHSFHVQGITGLSRLVFGPLSYIDFHPAHGLLLWSSDEPILGWYALDGSLDRIIRLDMVKEPVTDEDRANHHAVWQSRIRQEEDDRQKQFLREWKQQETFPEYKSYWSDVNLDDAGFIWMNYHYDFTGPTDVWSSTSYRVLSPKGEYLGDAAWPSIRGYIYNGYLLTRVENTETDLVEYTVYRIRSNVRGLEYP